MLDHVKARMPLRERMLESERLMEETGCYDGITSLKLRKQDPLKFETLHTKLRAYCVSAREMARRISASPGVREVGEMVVALYTPEGDAIALSNGIMVHVHTMSRFIKWMIREGYEANPGNEAIEAVQEFCSKHHSIQPQEYKNRRRGNSYYFER